MPLPASKSESEPDKVTVVDVDTSKLPTTTNVKVLGKTTDSQPYLDVPLRNTFRSSLDSLSAASNCSSDQNSERVTGRSLSPHSNIRISSRSPAPPKTWKAAWQVFWDRNKGVTLVLLSQFFGALMVVATRLLETDGSNGGGMQPFQVRLMTYCLQTQRLIVPKVLFARMSVTSLCCGIYMWWAKVPDAPFGKRDIQGLLVVRGVGGFFGGKLSRRNSSIDSADDDDD